MMLECRGLTKWFGSKEAVADLTLNIEKRENIRVARGEWKRQNDLDEDGIRAYKTGNR